MNSGRRWTWRHTILIAGLAAVVALVVVGQLAGFADTSGVVTAMTAAIAVAYTAMGAFVLAGVAGHRVGTLLLTAGLLACLAVLAVSWSSWLAAAWVSQWAWWPPFGLMFLTLLVFPDGRLPSRRWRIAVAVIVGATVLTTVALAIAALDYPRNLVTDVIDFTGRAQVLIRVAGAGIVLAAGGLLAGVCSLWIRWRHAGGEVRQQLAYLLAGAVLLVLGLVLDAFTVPGAQVVMAVALPLSMTAAVLRHRLYDLDQIVNRTAVWLVMTLLVIAGYVVLVEALSNMVTEGNTSLASIAATGLIAVAFEPLRRRVQRGLDRLLYGDRDDPYVVIARLGDLLGHTLEPNAVLPLLTGTIVRSLQVPYVAVEVAGGETPRLLAEHGSAITTVEAFEMQAHGRHIGRLLVANRGTGARFTPRERRLLGDVALQAAVAVEASLLIADLQTSRERLVTAREEERRRLRRDLHDGLGPALAGMSMQVRAAHKMTGEQTKVRTILTALAEDLKVATTEVRQLVDQLRPPALDAGLEAALRSECQRFNGSALQVRLRVEDPLDGLPAALEVAAYRIVAEALTNAARHSKAGTCQVTVRRAQRLSLEIVDDGVGIASSVRRGMGLDSMQRRAAELGGTCEITAVAPHGTAVRVSLPVAATAEPQERL